MTTKPTKPVGELFSRLYVERGAPTQDSQFFRNRLSGYVENQLFKEHQELAEYLKQEAGLIVLQNGNWFNFPQFFYETSIEHVLSAITLIWRFLMVSRRVWSSMSRDYVYPQADAWRGFVARAFREENLAYAVDDLCGVHYFVDEEFERNRVSVLRGTESPRYAGVRAAFQAAHLYLDAQPPDTKASVRSMFEALEILARLMDPASARLNRSLVQKKLKPLVVAGAADPTEGECLGRLLDGVAEWVDAAHLYRHGQGRPEPVAPSLGLAVYALSSGAAALRLLLDVDAAQVRATPPAAGGP